MKEKKREKDEETIPYARERYLNKQASKCSRNHFPIANKQLKGINPIWNNLIKAFPRHFSYMELHVLPQDPHIWCTNMTLRKPGTYFSVKESHSREDTVKIACISASLSEITESSTDVS